MSFADAVARPLYDARAYREAGARPALHALVQLARLSLVSAVVATAVATLWLSSVWRERVVPIIDTLPTITITKGVASVDAEQPWGRRVLRDRAGHDWVVVLDTTGKTRDLAPGQGGVLLLKKELRLRGPGGHGMKLSLSRVGDVKLGPEPIKRLLLRRLMLVPPLLLVASLAYFLVGKALQALALAWWLGRGAGGHSMRARLNVAACALSAPVALQVIAFLMPLPAWLVAPAYVGLALLYGAAGDRPVEAGS